MGICLAAALFFSSGIRLPVLDTTADHYFRESVAKAGIAYATCRVINASVSIIKESTLQLEPAGIGMSLAVGQALDPIDDMTERLSDVLVTAITSLGVQKLAYEISVSVVPPVLSFFLFALILLSWCRTDRFKGFQTTLARIALLILIARFCLPLSSMANEAIHTHFFMAQISEANKELAMGSSELDSFKEISFPEIDGFMGTIENSAAFLKQKSSAFKAALAAMMDNTGKIIENLLALTFLYVGMFLIQVIILPVLTFFFLVRITAAAGDLFPSMETNGD